MVRFFSKIYGLSRAQRKTWRLGESVSVYLLLYTKSRWNINAHQYFAFSQKEYILKSLLVILISIIFTRYKLLC